jgi:ankyrin repeat domain-containing protein 50
MEYLRQAATRSRHIYILLDALDECPADNTRDDVLSAIQTIRQWSLPGLHLLITSRDVVDIRQTLNVEAQNTVSLKNENVG